MCAEKNKMDYLKVNMAQVDEFTARPYQIELYEKALAGNTIIYLPTGSGKTYIVVMVIKKMSADVRKPWNEGGKLSVFLVNTVPLVVQQCAYIARHSDLTCSGYTGDMNVDIWDANMWQKEFNDNQVLVMTSQIFLDILAHGYLPLSRINLIIFDECHHAVGDHPMRLIMKRFEDYSPSLQPRVLGTSATLLNSNVKIDKVDETVRDLEITFHAKVTTVDSMKPVEGYGQPKEIVHYYNVPDESSIGEQLQDCINHAIYILDTVKLSPLSPNNESSKVFQSRSKGVKLKCIFESIKEDYKTQGLYFANKSILFHMIQLEQMKRCIEDLQSITVLDFLITELTIMRKIIANEMKGSSDMENLLKYSSDQIKGLFRVIYEFYCDNVDNKKFCSIIFVRRRFTAKILYHVLKRRAEMDDRFKFLVPQYVVGNSADPLKSPYETMCLQKWCEEALIKFRAGIINCLVATDVLDEGIDVPSCSLVIRYDIPQDFRAYVQSKGRARNKDSCYVLLSSESQSFKERYHAYREVEGTLANKLVGNSDRRLEPLPEDLKQKLYTSEIEPFTVVNAAGIRSVITEVSAISLVNRYCSTLAQSKFVKCVPTWILKEYRNGSATQDEVYVVTIHFPAVSPLRETIQGDVMSSISSAKRSAAMKTCKKLYEIGELSDNLLPKNAAQIVADISILLSNWQEEDDESKKVVGTSSNKRAHDIVYPEALYGAFPMPNQASFLHVISSKPTYTIPSENRNWAFYNMFSDRADFAILSSKQMPKIPNFPIHMNMGVLETKINVNFAKITLSSDEIMQLRRFHWVIFNEVLELIKSFMIYDNGNKENSFLIVPVDQNWKIDWDIVRRYPSIRREAAQNHSIRAITNDTDATPALDECGWQLVTPNYRTSTSMYVVTKICEDLMPKSAFPTDDYVSYVHYFRERHGLQITDEKQPMLEVKPISNKINCIKPRDHGKTTNKRKRTDLEEHLVPELCYKVVFPALYWLKATLLPSILHRVSQLFIAEDLRKMIATESGLGILKITVNNEWESLKLQKNDSDENIDAFVQMETILDENNSLDNTKSDLIPTNPDADILSLDSSRYPWPKDQEPCDLDRNIEDVQMIDIDYYHSFTKSCSKTSDLRIKSKHLQKGFVSKPNVSVPVLKVLNRTTSTIGPSPADIMPAITPKVGNDAFNLERLETLGDSYLKFITSIYLFEVYPTFNEGRLTSAKGKIIGNRHLYYCGRSKNIPGRLKVDDFEPLSNFIVPSYCTPRQLQTAIKSKNKSPNVLYEIKVPPTEKFQGELSAASESTFQAQIDAWVDAKNTTGVEQFVGFQVVPDKTVSDAVESLTGVYLNSMGLNGAARFLKWFGIFPNDMDIIKILNVPSSSARLGPGDIDYHIDSAIYIENVLGYKFVDRSFLLQAFTHPSYTPNSITASYDRLEFLGDAVIDFLITVYIYENCGDLSPGALTDLRSALVNNITFACITVKYGLHRALLAYAPSLTDIIERFVKFQQERDNLIDDELLWILMEEDECNMAEYVDVPKVLGDLYESVIGAIYLDSGKDLAKVWEIIYSLMCNEIHSFSKNVPKQPVRVIYETQGAHPKFLNSQVVEGCNTIMVPLEVQIFGKKKLFHGFGATKKQAKAAAAKLALKSLRHNL